MKCKHINTELTAESKEEFLNRILKNEAIGMEVRLQLDDGEWGTFVAKIIRYEPYQPESNNE